MLLTETFYYRISANSIRENYSFLNLGIVENSNTVKSRVLARLVSQHVLHAGFFRLSVKGKFDVYLL